MNPYFEKLGLSVATQWQQQNFSLHSFPDLARAALEQSPPSLNIDLDEMIHEFLLKDEQPFQSQSGFGQPELVAFNHPRFYIQILFWLEGTTQIHQHEFSGAFHVMHGSSIHSEFGFQNARSVTPHLSIGDLHMKQIELLETGRTVPITSGRENIHSLFHLDTPSVTVVIRTHHDPGTGPQFNYLPPHIALDPLQVDGISTRRHQLLDVLETLDDPAYAERVNEMVETLDFERGFHTLRYTMNHLQNLGEWEPVLAAFQKKHGDLANQVPTTLAECLRRENLTGMRHHIGNPDHRFFLALLMNVPTRQDILAFIAQRVPDRPPIETLLDWINDLIEPDESGATLLDVSFPETFDLPLHEQSPSIIAALAQALERPTNSPPETIDPYQIIPTISKSALSPLFF